MKHLTLFFILFFFTNTLVFGQQFTNVVNSTNGVDNPRGLVVIANELYIMEYGDNEITKIDLSAITEQAPLQTPSQVLNNVIRPNGVAYVEDTNTLYYGDSSNGDLWALDLGENPLNPRELISDEIFNYFDLAYHAASNDLYISGGHGVSKIFKLDLDDISAGIQTVISLSEKPFGMAFRGGELYFTLSEDTVHKISKIDVALENPSAVDLVTAGLDNPRGIAFHGDDLYIVQMNNDRVSKINVANFDGSLLTPTDVATTPNQGDTPEYIVFDGDYLYITFFHADLISRLSIATLSNEKFSLSPISIYPNPSKEILTVEGLTTATTPYVITDITGRTVQKGVLQSEGSVQIDNLQNGLYVIRISDQEFVFKFLKK